MALLIKDITTYQQTKSAYDGYRAAKNNAQYRAINNESALILHEAAAKALKAVQANNGGKTPPCGGAASGIWAGRQREKSTIH